MATTITLLTTADCYENLCQLADGRQRRPKVDRDALNHLLMDHQKMINALRSSTSFKVVEPQAKRQRLTLRG